MRGKTKIKIEARIDKIRYENEGTPQLPSWVVECVLYKVHTVWSVCVCVQSVCVPRMIAPVFDSDFMPDFDYACATVAAARGTRFYSVVICNCCGDTDTSPSLLTAPCPSTALQLSSMWTLVIPRASSVQIQLNEKGRKTKFAVFIG